MTTWQKRLLPVAATLLAFFIAITLLTYQSVKDAPKPTVTPTKSIGPCKSQIAFISMFSPNNNEIYVMDSDSTDVRRLTNNDANDLDPVWSTDGSQIAFVSNRSGTDKADFDVFVMKADGSDQRRLTSAPSIDQSPAWSPDGKKIAYASMQNRDGQWDIFVMNADGTDVKQLTHGAISLEPSWSPDGSEIVYAARVASIKNLPLHVFVMKADGSDPRDLSPAIGEDIAPRWSPDGKQIAFLSTRDGHDATSLETHHIYVMNADGSNQHRVSDNLNDYGPASWSPDSSSIVFSNNRDHTRDVYSLDLLSGTYSRLTSDPLSGGAPAWSPCLLN